MEYDDYVKGAKLRDYENEKKIMLGDIKDHEMRVLKDDGIYRHLRFRSQGSNSYWFDLVTWPGCLVINGDCGTYSFSRLPGMFEFFRNDELKIRPSYYAEKLLGPTTYKKYSRAALIHKVDDHIEEAFYGDDQVVKKSLQDDVADVIFYDLDDAGPELAYAKVYNYEYDDGTLSSWQFVDFWDGGTADEYDYHYLWSLYAIVWGIREYDRSKGK